MRLNLEQARMDAGYQATWAFAFRKDAQGQQQRKPGDEPKTWKTHVMGFGTNVQRCGLLQALAFLRRDEQAVYNAIESTLKAHLKERGFIAQKSAGDLLEVVRTLPSMEYMTVSREVLALSLWIKRAAQILCGGA